MDIVSHGLWGGIAGGHKSKKYFFLAFLFGVLPDIVPFSLEFFRMLLGYEDSGFGPLDESQIPEYVFTLYNFTHSLVFFAVVFLLIWMIVKKPFLPMVAWGLHILIDIPTHSAEFFPTPFLWPVSDFYINGTSWIEPVIFVPNIVLLCGFYLFWFYQKRKQS